MIRYPIAACAALLLATGASAQTAQTADHNPVVKNGAPHTIAAPARGANSFTANQARGRFAKAGYTSVTQLTKAGGTWQAMAMKGGRRHTVMLDYKGNITAR